MTLNRIQKLLFTEYSDFEDHVLLESPFAQTTKEGEGIQQLHIGLTPTKLILAKDFLEWKEDTTAKEDPLVGTLELVSMLPVEFVNLSVYRRKTRNTIKARFCNQQVLYFELAASFRREMFWNLWCERMKFLCPEEEHRQSDSSDSGSESSSSSSGIQSYRGPPKAWEERNLFLGADYSAEILKTNNWLLEEKNGECEEPSLIDITRKNRALQRKSGPEEYQRVYRFGLGIDENCGTSLYLPANPALVSCRTKESKMSDGTSDEDSPQTSYQFLRLIEDAVRTWERNINKPKLHKRSTGLTPFPNHLSGMGCIGVSRGASASLQMKRSASEVKLRDAPEEVQTGIPKRLLVSSISCENLIDFNKEDMDAPLQRSWRLKRSASTQLYWTTNVDSFTSSSAAYKTLRKHLQLVHDYKKSLGVKKKRSIWTRMKKSQPPKRDMTVHHLPSRPARSYNTLRKELKMDITVSSWDFDSTILSYQLTLLDRDLLLMIAPSELQTLLTERSSRNASNIKVMIDFSNRISNLVVTEIVRLDSLKMRARLIGKYINVADKLHRLHNMHSTKSILNGLTSPALYRLINTWTYVRRHHYSKYKRLKTLIRLYKDVRTPLYSKMLDKFSRTPPYLPSISCIIYGLLGLLPKANNLSGSKSYTSITSSIWGKRQRMNSLRTQSADGSLESETTKNSLSSESGEFSHSENILCCPHDWECGPALRLAVAEKALKAWQNAALTYDLIESPLVREFLLKAKYLEEQESFFFSQNIEPNETPEEITLNKILNEVEDAE